MKITKYACQIVTKHAYGSAAPCPAGRHRYPKYPIQGDIMLAKEHIDDLLQRNGNVLSADGDKIGSVGQVYADDADGQPTWVTVKTGLFGTSESFVPLQGARLEGDRSEERRVGKECRCRLSA